MAGQARQYHWDFARAFYLLLGIPFHSAVVYSAHHVWAVSSPVSSPTLTLFTETIHTFRMPGFFILAGYFSMMMLLRQGPGGWMRARMVRLGVPLLTASLTILPFQIAVQQYALTVTGALPPNELGAAILHSLTHFDEPWISHLWFLWCLIAYSVGLATLVAICGTDRFTGTVKRIAGFFMERKWLGFALFCTVAIPISLVLPWLYEVGGRHLRAAFAYNAYFIYFVLGGVMFISGATRSLYCRAGLAALAVGLVLAEISIVPSESLWMKPIAMISGIVAALLITGYVTQMAMARFDTPDRMVRRFVDASFTIYLFHHPVIFVLATLFLSVNWPPVMEFAVIMVSAGLISYAIHVGIARSQVLLFLFNGTRSRPQRKTASQSSQSSGTSVSPAHRSKA